MWLVLVLGFLCNGVEAQIPALPDSFSLLNLHKTLQAIEKEGKDFFSGSDLLLLPYSFPLPGFEKKIDCLFYPYWLGDLYTSYQFDRIERMGFFGYIINPIDGTSDIDFPQLTNNLIQFADSSNTAIDLVLCCTGREATNLFLESDYARDTFINIVRDFAYSRNSNVSSETEGKRKVDGINIYFPDFDFKLKREFGLLIKKLFWAFHLDTISTQKLIVTFPEKAHIHFDYILSIQKYIDEIHFVDYDYRGVCKKDSIKKVYLDRFNSKETNLGFIQQIVAEVCLAEFNFPRGCLFSSDKNNAYLEALSADQRNNWECYFLGICAILIIIILLILSSRYWCRFNKLVGNKFAVVFMLTILLTCEIFFLTIFMIEEMSYDTWLINTNNPDSKFFLLIPILLVFLFPALKILRKQQNLP